MPYNILLVCDSNFTGLQYHRLIVPYSALQKSNPEFMVKRVRNIKGLSDEEMKEFKVVVFLRFVGLENDTEFILDRCHRLGCKTIMDIDDYWNLPSWHPMKPSFTEIKYPEQTETALRLVNYVTTTTEYFADIIRPFNHNVCVLPNAIDTTHEQMKPYVIQSPLIRFGWIGGVHHIKDIELLLESCKRLFKDREIEGKFQFSIGGFSDSNHYKIYESIVTDGLKNLNPDIEYKKYLLQFSNVAVHIMNDKSYKRIWGTENVSEYMYQYNDLDVCVVPLYQGNGHFAKCKSQLKIIEAGFMGKAVIVSETMPYTIDCKHMENCLMVREGDELGWYLAMKKLLKEPDLRLQLAKNLSTLVREKYDIEVVNKQRVNFLKSIA